MSKKTNKPKISFKGIMAKKGVYITLLTFIIVLGTAAVIRKLTPKVEVGNETFDDTAWKNAVASAATDEKRGNEDADADASGDYNTLEDGGTKESGGDLYEEENEVIPVSKELNKTEIIAALNMSAPIAGEISKKYSPDDLIYSKTMNDWRTHSGIDIAANSGDIVSAAADGVVEEVYEDDNLGVVVVIGHGNGVRTLYGNLQDKNYIEVGRKVSKGDSIGAVGDSSILEGKDGAHVHFEVTKDGNYENPSEFIPS